MCQAVDAIRFRGIRVNSISITISNWSEAHTTTEKRVACPGRALFHFAFFKRGRREGAVAHEKIGMHH
jgi:hypothetical protein